MVQVCHGPVANVCAIYFIKKNKNIIAVKTPRKTRIEGRSQVDASKCDNKNAGPGPEADASV